MRSGEAQFVGRADVLRAARELIDAAGQPPLLCIHGSTEIGKSRTLERIATEASERKHIAVYVDLEERRAPEEVSSAIRSYLKKPLRPSPLTRAQMIEERIVARKIREEELRAAAEAAVNAGKTAASVATGNVGAAAGGGAGVVKPLAKLARRPFRALVRRKQRRWVKQRLARLPRGNQPFQQRSRRDELNALLAPAVAADLADIANRRRSGRVVVVLDNHQRLSQLLEPGQNEDFTLALVRHLRQLGAPVAVAIARDGPLSRSAVPTGHGTSPGTPEGLPIVERRLGPLRDEDIYAILTELEVDSVLARDLADLCLGHPGIAIRAAREELSPTIVDRSLSADDERSVQRVLRSILDELLQRRDESSRRLLKLAALPRRFDLGLLEALAVGPIDPSWIAAERRRGMLQGASGSKENTWQVERVWRGLLLRGLTDPPGREFFVHGNTRALEHIESQPSPADPEERFQRSADILYHKVSLDPEGSFSELAAVADAELAKYRTDRCEELLEAAEDLYSVDRHVRVQATILRAKLYGDLNQYAFARSVLADAEREHPIAERFDPSSVAIALERAKIDRLSGNYQQSRRRLEAIAERAEDCGEVAVAAHCTWERSLILKQQQDLGPAFEALEVARFRVEELLGGDAAEAEREARRFGISRLRMKPAHMQRHEAELRRLRGDYSGAHAAIDAAIEAYVREEPRASAHAMVVRAHILRMEGLPADARELATDAERRAKEELADERLYLFALRADVLARIALDERPGEQVEELIAADPDLYPAGAPSGFLGRAEIARRDGQLQSALHDYALVREAAERSGGQMETCGALIGTVECLRAGASGPPELELDRRLEELLEHPGLPAMPWLGLRAQLERAIVRPDQREDALAEATRIGKRFARRPQDARIDEKILGRVASALQAQAEPEPIRLEYL